MPKGMPLAELPSTASTIINTIAAMELNSTYIQYSWRVALPSNTAYFFNACRYQLIVSSSRLERCAVVGDFLSDSSKMQGKSAVSSLYGEGPASGCGHGQKGKPTGVAPYKKGVESRPDEYQEASNLGWWAGRCAPK